MMRPSHPVSTTLQSHPVARRVAAAGLVVLVQMMVVWALVGGLAMRLTESIHPFDYVAVDDPVKLATPPPIPRIKDILPPKVAPPVVTFTPDPGPDTITVSTSPQPPVAVKPSALTAVAAPDRSAIAIAATQTTPPYPALAQRLGAEGKVILRLSVLADGTVGKAEIVTSSGRHDLDETAQQWIVAHWDYKPALKDGAPVASQILVIVRFTLKDAP